MKGWFTKAPNGQVEYMVAEEGKRLYVKLARPNLGHHTDPNGELEKRNGWVYGSTRGRDWSCPETAIVGIEES